MSVIRVFPRRTTATPVDPLAFIGEPPFPELLPPADRVEVSCTFTWDMPAARRLVKSWRRFFPDVRLGGPATDDCPGDFEPGRFLRPGYVITSRGCPNRCSFCLVPDREGPLRTLPIHDGWDVLDNNLLACPQAHIDAVLEMLARQPVKARYTGGLEALRLSADIARQIVEVGFDIAYTAYDRPPQRRHVQRAVAALRYFGGWSERQAQRKIGVYVLCGYSGDSEVAIEKRLRWIVGLGATPFPMFYRAPEARRDPRIDEMKRSLRKWMRPASMYHEPGGDDGQLALPLDSGAVK